MIDKYQGALVGLAIGDTLGMPLEFKHAGAFEPLVGLEAGGPFNLPLGYWTDDTSMSLCLADGLLEKRGYDSYDVMDRYWAWRSEGYRSSTGKCFDIGNQTSTCLNEYMGLTSPIISKDKVRLSSAGNGSIMRLAPIVIASHAAGNSLEKTMELSWVSGRETHYSYMAEAATALFGAMLYNAFEAKDKSTILAIGSYQVNKELKELLTAVKDAEKHDVTTLKPTGYALDSLVCAVWAFMDFTSFKDGALAAVNLGGDADTIGAIYGQLAGAYYGYAAIPKSWRKGLYLEPEIADIAYKLSSMESCEVLNTRFEEDGEKYTPNWDLRIANADITKLSVDCIVNAANTELLGGGGVCGAIFDAAGYENMSNACRDIGSCEYGDAVITPGFKLPAKHVIHTVGPIYGQHDGNDADILRSCYWQSLRLAQEHRIRSIAFPLISTGIYGYPKEEAITIAISAIRMFFEDNFQTSLEAVTLVAFGTEDYELLKQHME